MTWNEEQWQGCVVHLHPVLKNEKVKNEVVAACQQHQSLDLSQYIKLNTKQPVILESHFVGCLLPLWEQSQPFTQLWRRWLNLEPLSLDTLEPKTPEKSMADIRELLTKLEVFNYIFIELKAS